MKCKNMKYKISKNVAEMALKLAKLSVDGACIYIYHQPKIPEALKDIKSKKK